MNPIHPTSPASSRTAGIAIASLVLGILSFLCLGPLASIPAVICGHIALRRIRTSQGALTGDGLGLAGLIIGYINLAFSLIMIPLLLAIAIPNFVKARSTAQQNQCINNLRQLDGAKQQWALENKKDESSSVSESELDEYLKHGVTGLKCPAGGTYTIGSVGELPTCSKDGHELEE